MSAYNPDFPYKYPYLEWAERIGKGESLNRIVKGTGCRYSGAITTMHRLGLPTTKAEYVRRKAAGENWGD